MKKIITLFCAASLSSFLLAQTNQTDEAATPPQDCEKPCMQHHAKPCCNRPHVQMKESPQEIANKKTERMAKELNLTAQQTLEIQKLNNKQAQKCEKAHKKAEKQRAKKHEKHLKAKAKEEAKLKKILTTEQFEKWQQNKEDKRQKMHKKMQQKMHKKHHNGPRADHGPAPKPAPVDK